MGKRITIEVPTEPKFEPGDAVYVIADPDQAMRQVISIVITPNGLMYTLRMDGELVDYYEIELSESIRVI